MKKIFVCVAALLLFSYCSAPKETQKFSVYRSYDFTPYSAKGFLFTPEKYTGTYESVGIISVEVYPEIKKNPRESDFENYIAGSVTTNEVIDSLYYMSIEMGADALINFYAEKFDALVGGIWVKGIAAGGFAIKRGGNN